MKIQRFLAIIFLIIIVPILLIIAIIIMIESKGNPIFIQKRVGKEGKIFIIYKLRTMKLGKEPSNVRTSLELSLHEKYRITRFGKFLRKTHIDELPQLWNIFTGEMLFVGPRPNIENLLLKRKYYAPIDHNILPGLTGISQLFCLKKLNYEDTSRLDKFYCKNKNILLDLSILFETFYVILLNKQKHC